MSKSLERALDLILLRCDGRQTRRTANGSIFIGPLSVGNSAWLHYLYSPCLDVHLEQLQTALGFVTPADYKKFMQFSNGASLYELTMHFSGVQQGHFNRDVADKDVAPLSIEEEIELFSVTDLEDWERGWRPVGELVAHSRYGITINACGNARITDERGSERRWKNFADMITTVLLIFDENFDCFGVKGRSFNMLEEDLSAMVGRPA